MNDARYMNETSAGILEDTWFRCTRGVVKWHGRVLREMPGCRFLVAVSDWPPGGPEVGKIVTLDEMQEKDWAFYVCKEDMLRAEALEAVHQRPNQPLPF